MSNTPTLALSRQGPVPEVIALLEDMLRRAYDGEIIGLGVIAACTGRADASAYALGDADIATMVLACERIKARLLREGE